MTRKMRVCVFSTGAPRWVGKDVEWFVCAECQSRILKSRQLPSLARG